jgi:hypothetical protein
MGENQSNLRRNREQNASAIEKNEKRKSLSDVSRIE